MKQKALISTSSSEANKRNVYNFSASVEQYVS